MRTKEGKDMHRTLGLTSAVLGSILVALGLLAGAAYAQEPGTQPGESVKLQLTPSRNSGVSGTATLTNVKSGVEVTLDMHNLPEAGVEHINHFHGGGTCADDRAGNTAPVTIPLDNVEAKEDGTGSATTTIPDTTLAQLFDPSEERFILLHAKTEEGGGIPPGIACADLDPSLLAEATSPGETTAKERLPSSGGLTAGSVLLPAAVLLLGMAALGYALVRRR
jgi:Cu/Zn superoxide dismutase